MTMKMMMMMMMVMMMVKGDADLGFHGGPQLIHGHTHAQPVHHAPIPYDFGYGVHDHYTGNDFGHTENSDGNGGVRGMYYVLLPDGRRQVVRYTADHYNGYQAHVSYEGTAHHGHGVGGHG